MAWITASITQLLYHLAESLGSINWQDNLYFAFQVFLAGICGAALGLERKSRLKEAGLRTHVIVAIASAVMMIISKHGFYDVISNGIRLDPSRIGAGVVTAVSFLGAGMIFMRRETIIGLTTAAGLWATVGVGMAAGSGLLFLAVYATLAVLLLQVLTHRYSRLDRTDIEQRLIITVASGKQGVTLIESLLTDQKIEILSLKASKLKAGTTEIEVLVKCPEGYDPARLFDLLDMNSNIVAIEL